MSTDDKPWVLVTDNDPETLTQSMRILGPDDFNIVTAICRASALSAARKLPLDLVLCEWSMGTSGSKPNLIDEIHSIPQRGDVPVIFTSAGQVPGVIRRQHDFGGAYHIQKPFEPAVLISLVERSLWMPHLVQTHIHRPHFQIRAAIPLTAGVTETNSMWGVAGNPVTGHPIAGDPVSS